MLILLVHRKCTDIHISSLNLFNVFFSGYISMQDFVENLFTFVFKTGLLLDHA